MMLPMNQFCQIIIDFLDTNELLFHDLQFLAIKYQI